MYLHGNPLKTLIEPQSAAVFGSGPIAAALIENLRTSKLRDRLYWIGGNPGSGVPCPPSCAEIPGTVGLALLDVPAAEIAATLETCGRKGISIAVAYATDCAGGDAGLELLRHLRHIAFIHKMRLFGPGALGCILPHASLNLTPVPRAVPAGNLALVSQSAAVCANILDWNHNDEFGFSALFGPGLGADLDLPELLDFLAADQRTESILLYLEGIHDARRFLSALRAAAAVKPVIALKSGRGPTSAAVAEAHSRAAVDRDDAFGAALRRAGALRVYSIGDMFSAARALTTPRKPNGNRLAIVANGGGPTVMAIDHAESLGIVLASLAPQTIYTLRDLHPAPWSPDNPVDVTLTAPPERFVGAIAACAADPGVDAVLAILTPNAVADPLAVATSAIETLQRTDKPVLTCLLGEVQTQPARAAFAKARFPVFRTPESAVAAFAFMVDWVRNQTLLRETPPALSSYVEPNIAAAQAIVANALAEDRQTLAPTEAKAVLAAFHIPTTPTEPAATATEAVAVANRLGYPVAMKCAATAGTPSGALLGLRSAAEVALAYRELTATTDGRVHLEPHVERPLGRWLRISIRPDRVFGPVIALSEAGIAPDIYDARSIALPPLNPRLVGEMIGIPHVARLLGPLRHLQAVAQEPLRNMLLRTSEIASELPWLHALDITLAAGAVDAVAVDARLSMRRLPEGSDRYAHMAICPYPSDLVGQWPLKEGSHCVIRPIRPDDAEYLQEFVRALSPRSRHLRFFSTMRELPQSSLARYTQIDYSREQMLIATTVRDGKPTIVGEANFGMLPDGKRCEFAVVIADDMAGQGLGTGLMKRLMDAARRNGLQAIGGQVMADNEPMLALMDKLDFVVKLTDDMDIVEVSRPL